MTEKKCMIFETLGNVGAMQQITEGVKDGFMRLSGVFGIAGVKNQNNRIYDKANYTSMVESLQKAIAENGCLGELEHPNSMNIDLNNVSHKIESIEMNEDGTVTGTILLLNTPKGKIAQAIVEAGNPLFISSRGAGTITNEGRVTLSSLKTYDLVGTPGFSQAKFTLKENQTVECLNENLEEGNYVYAIIEGKDEDLLGGDDEDDKKDKKEDSGDDLLGGDDKDDKKEEPKDEPKDDEKDKKEDKDKSDKKEDDNKNNKDINMNDLKEAIDKLTEKVTSLEAELHVAQESLAEVKPIDYSSIEQWVTEEFGNDFKETLMASINETVNEKINDITNIDEKVNEKIKSAIEEALESFKETINETIENKINESVETIANGVQSWVVEEFAPEVQNWVTEEFAPEVQNWITEEFAPEVQNWITEEFAPEVQNWIVEEYTPTVDSWITGEFAPATSQQIEEKVNANVSAFMESQKAGRLENIDSLLEAIANDNNSSVNKIVKEATEDEKFKGVYVVENMPEQYKPSWQMLDESLQEEIVRTSRAYDFTKEGVLESFWANVDFNQKKEEPKESPAAGMVNENYYNSIVNQMKLLRKVPC